MIKLFIGETGTDMGRPRFKDSLTIYLLLCLFVAHLSKCSHNLPRNVNLQMLVTARDSNQARIRSFSSPRKRTSKTNSTMAPSLKFVLATRLLNIFFLFFFSPAIKRCLTKPRTSHPRHRNQRPTNISHQYLQLTKQNGRSTAVL